MDEKEVHIYNGLLDTEKNETMPFAEPEMKLEQVTQLEVSQKARDT